MKRGRATTNDLALVSVGEVRTLGLPKVRAAPRCSKPWVGPLSLSDFKILFKVTSKFSRLHNSLTMNGHLNLGIVHLFA